MKTCSKCERAKPLDSFRKHNSKCRACVSERDLARYRRLRAEGWTPSPEDPDKKRARARRYHAANPDRARAYVNARRARLAQAAGRHTERDWQQLVRRYRGCAYCGSAAPVTRDHVVPLSRGGSDFIGNILPACLSCNTSKKDRLLVDWRRTWQARAATRLPAGRLP